jgi:hypothetical protein
MLKNGKTIGVSIPRTNKEELVKPGHTVGFISPIKNMTQKPDEILVKLSIITP